MHRTRRTRRARMLALAVGVAGALPSCAGPPSGVDAHSEVGSRDASAVDARRDSSSTDGGRGRPPPMFAGAWGGYGTAPGQFIEPSSVELDSDGFVYVAGHEDRFQKFTADGELVAIFGEPGAGDGQFDHPHGLAIDRRRGDLVYVGDQENHRLQVFTTEGAFVRAWGDALFQHIHDVGIDPESGDLFVGDYELDTLRVCRPTGELIAAHGGSGAGPFEGVWGVSTDSDGNLYVADTFNRRVQKLDRDGRFIAEWRDFGGAPFTKPTGVFVDARDEVYVCDALADEVLVFGTDGSPLERWDLEAIVGAASEPEDIVLDSTGTHIYIGEVRGHRVLHLMR